MALIEKLKDEIFDIQERRHKLTMRKLAFAIGFLGIGATGVNVTSQVDFSPLLYLVPFIAIAFDVHICSEEYRIKRIGQFIMSGVSGATAEEIAWENFVRAHPSSLPPVQYLSVTILILVAAGLALLKTKPAAHIFVTWLIVAMILEVALVAFSIRLRHKLIPDKRKAEDGSNQASEVTARKLAEPQG